MQTATNAVDLAFLVSIAFAGLPAEAAPTWSAAIAGAVPLDGIAGGQENGKPLVVCRANHGGGVSMKWR
jgi:hypothetical protein